jgi:RHS repeat-associated protein
MVHTYTEYCGNHILENGKLKQSLFDGGYITYSDGEPEFHFYVRDHQGNNRLVMSEDGVVEQVNDYTPFGVQMKNSFTATSSQRYKYNGKELDRMFGLDLYDYGARFYDARIARWQTIDPLCEKYYSISPYVYCANNPIRFIDPNGKELWAEANLSYKEVQQIANNMQKLTDDKIMFVKRDNGKYQAVIESTAQSLKYPSGTKLVRKLIASKKVGNINITNSSNTAEPTNEKKAMKAGVGSGGSINFNPNTKFIYVTDPKSNNKVQLECPAYLALAHEMVHALHFFKGNMSSTKLTAAEPNLKNSTSLVEELKTVGLYPTSDPTENSIREEHHIKQRNSYK